MVAAVRAGMVIATGVVVEAVAAAEAAMATVGPAAEDLAAKHPACICAIPSSLFPHRPDVEASALFVSRALMRLR